MPKILDLRGQKFSRLLVLSEWGVKGKDKYWRCMCDCGKEVIASSNNLRQGRVRSCGCLQKDLISQRDIERNTKHNLWGTKLYGVWSAMKSRCLNPNNKNYKYYGARGITVCQEWKESFKCFYDWAMANRYQEGLTIDRKNNDGNYDPENCQWVSMKIQGNNRRPAIRGTVG
jgi:hypothetical protein